MNVQNTSEEILKEPTKHRKTEYSIDILILIHYNNGSIVTGVPSTKKAPWYNKICHGKSCSKMVLF